ncbi:twin-arginine translocation signal domain-containing protein [Natrarchaeobius chitinivorans]|uniref:Twin-arginine translocation signal domain-containing protein n=1 Tax=Natrarchaeobius chitinivorans TaxID=1679083 RepID=A0A3N6MKK1_NATCH|nr:twin-arginine translocation signal domain-containing protein [Natrarchaeobius chitinivorans]RQG96471.1 twin-arginine translocation signal domain-containing protein [Natrarchaeobius chitinivorans]
MKNEINPSGRVSRRTVLKTSAVGAATVGMAAPVTGDESTDDETATTEEEENGPAVDEPDGWEMEMLAPHAPFPDELAASFRLEYADDHSGDPITVEFDDAPTCIVGKATWDENSTTGWHRHPGLALVNMIEGEIVYTWDGDCVPRTYTAGDAWIDHGHVHTADSEGGAVAYVMMVGVPAGEPATEWVEPVDC